MSAQSHERLRHLFGAYFHQDWPLEFGDWMAVVRQYPRDLSPEEASAAAGEIDQLLAEGNPEAVLAERLCREFGCSYDPRPDLGGPSFRGWLTQRAGALHR
jgi:hypothetical protein